MRRDRRTAQIVAPLLAAALAVPVLSRASPSGRVLAQTTAGSASAASVEDKQKEAKEHFDKGVALMQEEAWDAALAEFTVSVSLFPTKNGRKNAAACLKALGRYDEALATYELLLKEFATKLKPEETDSANKAIAELKALTGTITIVCPVEGATVVIDGRDRGKTPLPAPVIVAAGTRVVRVSKEGYVPFEAKPIVAGKAAITIEARLEALARSGRLKVVEESGKVMDVLVDGAVVGKTPWEGTVAPGQHAVVLKGEGKLGTQPSAATVMVDQVFNLRLKAEELAGAARIDPDPAGATVSLDGVPLGQGAWEGAVRVGSHTVDVSAEGYFGASKTFDAPDGKKVVVPVKLDQDQNSPFWVKGRMRPVGLALFGGGMAGASLGSGYERSCGDAGTTCGDRARPLGFRAGARAGYDLAPGLAVELDLGYLLTRYSISRTTTMLADSPADVDIKDDVQLAGPAFGLGASYSFLRKPVILSGAVLVGGILGKVRVTRTGTVLTQAPPSPRELNSSQVIDNKFIPYVVPELRLGYPVSEGVQVGVALGVLIGITDSKPKVSSTAKANPGEQPKNPSGGTLGFIPNTSAAPLSAAGTFFLPQADLFLRLSF